MKILLVQTAFLGDVVLATPIIGKLAEMYPQAELWVMTTVLGRELLAFDTRIKGIITFDKRSRERGLSGLRRKAKELGSHHFEIVYSLHKSWRTSLLLWLAKIPIRVGFKQAKLSFLYTKTPRRIQAHHEVLRNFSLFSPVIGDVDSRRSLSLTAPDGSKVSPEAKTLVEGDAPYVAIFPGSAWKTKRWSADSYRAVVKEMTRQGKQVVLLGAQSEAALCSYVQDGSPAVLLAGVLSLADTMYVVKHASAVICNDSMALHVASAFQVPCVAIFCATSPEFGFGPWQNRHVIVEHKHLSCKPCSRHGGNVCPTRTERCMNDINPMRVIKAVEEVTWVN